MADDRQADDRHGYVAPEGLGGEALDRWLDQAAVFVRTVPPKR